MTGFGASAHSLLSFNVSDDETRVRVSSTPALEAFRVRRAYRTTHGHNGIQFG
ncbi:hypothetical protein ABIB60_001298 [Hymenobacter sp. UYP22]